MAAWIVCGSGNQEGRALVMLEIRIGDLVPVGRRGTSVRPVRIRDLPTLDWAFAEIRQRGALNVHRLPRIRQ
jgi:hypothetical protein